MLGSAWPLSPATSCGPAVATARGPAHDERNGRAGWIESARTAASRAAPRLASAFAVLCRRGSCENIAIGDRSEWQQQYSTYVLNAQVELVSTFVLCSAQRAESPQQCAIESWPP